MKKLLCLMISLLTLTSCVSNQFSVEKKTDLFKYRYVYIPSTDTKVSGVGSVYGSYGSSEQKSVTPSDIISGYFLKKGYIKVSEIKPEDAWQTLTVNYGESGRHFRGLGYSIEVTIQFVDSETDEIVCVGSAEGMGDTEADDIRKAVNKCLKEMFVAE